ncbi:hypothetical protein WV31_10560 [Magnetospirillum sp. ME-1]|uniref:hypothetical protein n=1 Tax=Magnetospirillum sp. ME-1 TaxID=1639348 RepID=UPI000A17F47F|nr:hypothetical protein [Magnetospirillum sp. ME-1]ARJ66069.1 hypothetical protein WV31_10560 [Magnetospirillum sp. ME-1]
MHRSITPALLAALLLSAGAASATEAYDVPSTDLLGLEAQRRADVCACESGFYGASLTAEAAGRIKAKCRKVGADADAALRSSSDPRQPVASAFDPCLRVRRLAAVPGATALSPPAPVSSLDAILEGMRPGGSRNKVAPPVPALPR